MTGSGQERVAGDVPVSPEQYAQVGTGEDREGGPLRICYQTFGDPAGDPLLLVMGLGGPMTWWDPEFCRMLAERGFYVIRYDNRDTGRSSRVRGRVGRAALIRAFTGARVRPPYILDDMAADAFALLDHLGIERAHIAGVSMGGMIVQTMAIARPKRVRSMTSIMSTSGKRTVGWQDPRLFPMLLAPRNGSRDAYIATSARMWKLIGSPGYPFDQQANADRAAETFDRGISQSGVMRQMLAILTQPNRSRDLRSLKMPVLVIHGDSDRMVHSSGGRATAQAIPGAELMIVPGMGHDLPVEEFAMYADAIRALATRADRT